MDKLQAIELAKEIIRLDMMRDEMVERLESIAGKNAYEILRWVQNGGIGSLPQHKSTC